MPRKKKTRPTGDGALGSRLAQHRRAKGWTQEELAKRLGVRQSVISHYERSRRGPDSDMLARIASTLGVSCDELLGLRQSRPGVHLDARFARRLRGTERLSRRDQDALLRMIEGFIQGRKSA